MPTPEQVKEAIKYYNDNPICQHEWLKPIIDLATEVVNVEGPKEIKEIHCKDFLKDDIDKYAQIPPFRELFTKIDIALNLYYSAHHIHLVKKLGEVEGIDKLPSWELLKGFCKQTPTLNLAGLKQEIIQFIHDLFLNRER